MVQQELSSIENINKLPKLITSRQLKQYLGCGELKLYELLGRRDFPSIRIGKKYYILFDKFIEWLEKESKKSKLV